MPHRRLVKSLKESLLRVAFVALLVGGAWLALQFYSEQEILDGARTLWAWWSTLFTGELAQYWNPAGAAIVLGVVLIFVLSPITRLMGTRRGHGHGYAGNDDFSDDCDDG